MQHLFTTRDTALLAEHSSDGILLLSATGAVEYANAQSERLFRRKANELVGVQFQTLSQDGLTSEATETLERATKDRVTGRFEIFHPGLYAWHTITAVPRESGVLLLIRDVTDRMRMLRDEAVRHGVNEVVSRAPIAISITRGPDHRFELVNVAARELLGDRDVIGLTLRNAFPELVEQGFVDLFDQVYASGRTYHASEVAVRFRRGVDEVLTDGIFNVTYQALLDANGTVSGVLSVSVDVSDQVKSRKRTEAMAAERIAILAQLAEGVIVADKDGVIRFVNDAAAELHGRADLDVAPGDYQATYELLKEDGAPYPEDELPLAVAVGRRESVHGARWRIRRPDGSEVLVEGSATPVSLVDGSSGGAVLTMHLVAE